MKCPLLKKACIQQECAWWGEWQKTRHVDGKPFLERNCIVVHLPDMLLELMRHSSGTKRMSEQLRTRMDRVADNTGAQARIMASMAKLALHRNGKGEIPGALDNPDE